MIGSITSPATKLLLIRFHFLDKVFVQFKPPLKFPEAFCYLIEI